jgi:hypothetical protein
MYGLLCALSAKRHALIEADPALLSELTEARRDKKVRGLLDLGKAWDALDILLSRRGDDAVLGDAVLARSGKSMRAAGAYGKARFLAPERVAEVAGALAKLPNTVIRDRYGELFGKTVHGNYGQESCAADELAFIREKVDETRDAEIEELESKLAKLKALYAAAAKAGDGMMAVVV